MRREIVRIAWLSVTAMVASTGLVAGSDHQVFGFEAWKEAVAELSVDTGEVVYPFNYNEEMASWARERTASFTTASPEVRLQALQQAFFQSGEFEFEYEATRTLTAEEAFYARNGNCMAFTSLFIAMARSLGYPAVMVAVERQPEIERQDGLVVVNRHVVAGYQAPQELYTYDFNFTGPAPIASRKILDDVLASAMYHTNLGGHAIREGNLERAVHNLELATVLAPDWAPAWVNLGVARSRQGLTESAFDALQRALEIESDNSSALVNLAKLYREMGRDEEADNAMRAAAESTRNPFTLISMADAEMLRGNLDEARNYLRRARWWYGREPEVYSALARLAELEGDDGKAARYRARAGELRQRAEDD
jgi:Flp pilus assembly protein TadD